MIGKKMRWITTLASMVAMSVMFASPAAADQPNMITITMNEYQPVKFQHQPLLDSGTVFLPLRETGDLLQSRTTWFAEGKRIVLNQPTKRIEMRLGSREAIVNGEPYTLPVEPKFVEGVVYVPVRFVSEAMEAEIHWIDKEKRVDISYEPKFLFTEKGVHGYWINRKSGELYISVNAEAAELVADTNVMIYEYGGLAIEALSPKVNVLRISDNYGEPHLNDVFFNLILVDGVIVLETKVHYWGVHPIRNVDKTKDGHALLMDGSILYEVDEAGKKVAAHDLQALTGYEDEAFQVEYYDEAMMVVRPHTTGWLTFIDRSSKEPVRLIDSFATEEQLTIYEELAGHPDFEFRAWDGLKVVGREGDTLKLTHSWFLDSSGPEREVVYPLP